MTPADPAGVLTEPPAGPDELDTDDGGFVPVRTRHRGAYIEMLVSSLLGLTASLVLSVEAVRVAANPHSSSICDWKGTDISCTAVAQTWQANLLGFPNAFLGLICEPVVITLAVAALGGVRFPRWFMNTAQAVYSFGFLFAFWLFYEAYFEIGKLCPWCLLITATTTLVFFSMTRVNLLDGNIRVSARVRWWVEIGVDQAVAVLLIAVVAIMVLAKYILPHYL